MTRSHILIVEARFYEGLADELASGAIAEIERSGGTYERISVPGAFEIPAAIAISADTGRFDGFVALGVIVRGETSHYDYVCGESARGLQDLAIQRRLAIGYGILTTENFAQAWERARIGRGDKGAAAAQAALAMIAIKRTFGNNR
jgi:6,7-dimethyl-8-ribityllumazine synthase